jgi:hypothetical protein
MDFIKVEATYEASKAEMTLHSLMRESIKASQECLNRIRAGETNGGIHSSKKGKDTGAVTPVETQIQLQSNALLGLAEKRLT